MNDLETIKKWVKDHSNRKEFARKMGVAVGTVHNWLAGKKPIPSKKMPLIKELMQGGNAAECPAPVRAVAVGLTSSEFEKVKEAAAHEHEELDLFARNAVLKRVSEVLKGRE